MDEQLVQVFLTNAVRTSQGPGPGAKTLPAAEAAALVLPAPPPAGYPGILDLREELGL